MDYDNNLASQSIEPLVNELTPSLFKKNDLQRSPPRINTFEPHASREDQSVGLTHDTAQKVRQATRAPQLLLPTARMLPVGSGNDAARCEKFETSGSSIRRACLPPNVARTPWPRGCPGAGVLSGRGRRLTSFAKTGFCAGEKSTAPCPRLPSSGRGV